MDESRLRELQLGDLPAQQRGLKRGDAVSLGQDLGGQRLVTALERREQPGLARHRGPRSARPRDRLRVLLGDPVHEVDPFDQLGEAVRLEDHRDQVRLRLLVARHQVLRQGMGRALELVLEVDQVVACREQLTLHGSELGLARGQPVLEDGQALVGVGQAVGRQADLGGIGSDLRAERRGRRLAGRDLALKIAGAAARQPRAEQEGGNDEKRHDPGGSGAFVGESACGCVWARQSGRARPTDQTPRLVTAPWTEAGSNLATSNATALPDPAYARNPAGRPRTSSPPEPLLKRATLVAGAAAFGGPSQA